jgi:UDP-glucose 4-epimerase
MREQLTVHGTDYPTRDGSCVRDYIHVVDLARAHVMALDWMSAREAPVHEVFNLGTGQGNTVLEVVNGFMEATGVKVPYTIGPRRPGDVESVYAETSKSRSVLGWSCQHDLKEALRDAWNWQQRIAGR